MTYNGFNYFFGRYWGWIYLIVSHFMLSLPLHKAVQRLDLYKMSTLFQFIQYSNS